LLPYPAISPLIEALGLAKLVLDGREYAELSRKIIQPQPQHGR
jgi:hypothetical protein